VKKNSAVFSQKKTDIVFFVVKATITQWKTAHR